MVRCLPPGAWCGPRRADWRRVQVKARSVDPLDKRIQAFSAFRSRIFEVTLFLIFDAARDNLIWARELTRDKTVDIGRRVERTNTSAAAVGKVLYGGTDVTALMQDA